jgi:hypothetical protein
MRGKLWLKGDALLQASRLHPEQCEAEGVLLRAGAIDVSADAGMPLEEGHADEPSKAVRADEGCAMASY